MEYLKIRGAREHNLKNIDLSFEKNKLVVITGVSGSGKSSLAFDTIYAEGQRRYIESLSAYARQFLEKLKKPDVDSIEGLSPAISIEQRTLSHNPRSTVGTVTEIYDYLRLLYAAIGKVHCHICGREITRQTVQEIFDQIFKLAHNKLIVVYAPVVMGQKGEYKKEIASFKKSGFSTIRIDGVLYDLDEKIEIDKNKKHDIDVRIDRVVVSQDEKSRITDSVETALKLAKGLVKIESEEINLSKIFSERYACISCGLSLPEIKPALFSFNNPKAACPHCTGIGNLYYFDPDKIIPDQRLSISNGAFSVFSQIHTFFIDEVYTALHLLKVNPDTPFFKLSDKVKRILIYGSSEGDQIYFEGLIPFLERKYKETESMSVKENLEKFISYKPCPKCNGKRLRPEYLSVYINGKNIIDVTELSIDKSIEFFSTLTLTKRESEISKIVLKEIKDRLSFLRDVGLGYLTLSRASSTLSGGEYQRIRLATQIGTALSGVIYVLDEPSIGLHQRDNIRLIKTLINLRNLGNTVIVVEHDEATIRSADLVIDMGPGAGEYGGYVVSNGTLDELMKNPESITARFLRGEERIDFKKERRKGKGFLVLTGARGNNLKNIDIKIPLGTLTVVTGVSGSGKSTLIMDTLYPALLNKLGISNQNALPYDSIKGYESISRIIQIDQSPIGRTPRSNAATYTGLFTPIRELFSMTIESKSRGYKAGRFSFNVKGGRCEVCEGAGVISVQMQFLPDVYVTCDECGGSRYNRETLEITYKGKTIADVLNMSVLEALRFFENHKRISRILQTLDDVGLGYLKIGLPATNLSGGEAQRIKLASELGKRHDTSTLYVMDEPTTGLHFADIKKLMNVIHRLVDAGNTFVIIEHNLDVIKCADYIIDLGPEGGEEGGFIVAEGTPEEIIKSEKSYTAQFLKPILTLKN
ncbi:MAG: excinuclease ABC subunit UvrA [Deltaproteobacteria bacterium]|nr:excinuclease ABC subunit UvrA [Deltaproteobacteria bacterium]